MYVAMYVVIILICKIKRKRYAFRQVLIPKICFHLTEVDPALVTVRSLNLTEFKLLPETEMFRLNVTWERPAFNFSNISSYVISYQINGGLVVSTNTVKHQTIYNFATLVV